MITDPQRPKMLFRSIKALIFISMFSLFCIEFGSCQKSTTKAASSAHRLSTPTTSRSTGATKPDNSSSAILDVKQYIIPNNTPIAFLDSRAAFDKLSPTEKLYVHHMSRASWLGSIIDLFQSSAESPYIFLLLQQLFRKQTLNQTQGQALKQCKFTAGDWDALLKYSAGFYHNLGNYQTYGVRKIAPNVSLTKVGCLVATVESTGGPTKVPHSASNVTLTSLWNASSTLMYNLENRYRQQGLKPVGVTTYVSSNFNEEDEKLVKEFMASKHVEGWNTRLFKTDLPNGRSSFEIRFASVNARVNGTVDGITLGKTEKFRGDDFWFSRGDFGPILQQVIAELRNARDYAGNDNEKKTISFYIDSFRTGSINAHKNASRVWVKDQGPVIETYIGFIETYQDPTGVSGSFEGMVAVVDKEKSVRLGKLVSQSEVFLQLLPWPRELEKDVFIKPDFTDLTVVSFANGAPPAGINLPNYNEVRTSGFKNVNLGNMNDATTGAQPIRYLNKTDADIVLQHRPLILDVVVGLHELLGHGSGKQFKEFSNGTLNFNASAVGTVGPFGPVKTWYKPGETYTSKFGRLGASMEECRADSVAIYLSLFPQVLKIWNINSTSADYFAYLLWLKMASEGLKALADYSPETDAWGQAHAQGRFAILRVMIDGGVVKVHIVNGTDGKPDLLIIMNRTRIPVEGKKAMGTFLTGLQFYRCTANIKDAQIFYDKYTSLKGPNGPVLLNWQRIAQDRKQPRALVVQPNTFLISDLDSKITSVVMEQYNPTAEGMIESFKDRFSDISLENSIFTLAARDLQHFLI